MWVLWGLIVMFVVSSEVMWDVWANLMCMVKALLGMLVKQGMKWMMGAMVCYVLSMLLFMNVYGLGIEVFTMYYPYVMVMSFLVWLMVVVDDMKYSKKFLSHFVPVGVGLSMGAVLSLLELISHLIRPLTLCVRLSTNITAGHVMLSMVSLFCFSSLLMSAFLGFMLFLVMLLEVVVAVLQSYIYSSLLVLYHSEFI
uniref:ATP synthase subunit a n=1 Tax=Macracanthorhynchus hirudinaceus TaxID=1032456 RepID=K0JA12_MACHR|nr:ATP synthase F0 subunit 6 [Macracanthorhynchus hirudinaceus]CCA94493.2 ATP synthase F0 subunit 6 [Macracanthorhynchus hirudinaceus]